MKRFSIILSGLRAVALAAALAALVSACSDSTKPDNTVATVSVLPGDHSLHVGDEVVLDAKAKNKHGDILSGLTTTWSSSDASVATVASNGRVIAVSPGTATIRATVDGVVGDAQVAVSLAPVARVDVDQPAVWMEVGDAKTVTAVPRDAAGRALSGRAVVWTSADPTIATVDANGRIAGQRPGVTAIYADVEGKRGEINLTVARAAVASISISPGAFVLEIGEGIQMTATVKDARGNVLTDRAVTWTLEDIANATITQSGVLRAVKAGYITITGASEGVSSAVGATIVQGEAYDFDLVYHRVANGSSDIFVLPIGTGAAPTRINAGNVSREPTASPDGNRIAFAVSQIELGTQVKIDDIFAVDRNGLNMKRLTTEVGHDDQPAWSPVAGRIAYRHYELSGARMDIWVMNADGTDKVNLTADMPEGRLSSAPAWSADGQRIAFATIENDAYGNIASIWTMKADGSDKQRITASRTGLDGSPSWAPEGQRIAFSRHYADGEDITIVTISTRETQQIQLPGRQYSPAWAPDGRFIAFVQLDGTTQNIYTMQPQGSRVRLRTVDASWGGGVEPGWMKK